MMRLRYVLKSFLGITVFIAFMFAAAGTLKYGRGWLLYAVSIFGFAVNMIPVMRNEQLMIERSSPGDNVKTWDKRILGILAILSLGSYVTAGLDAGRLHWSPYSGVVTISVGIALMVAGQLLFMAARMSNDFFSSVARIQKERKHSVCDSGVYRIVRHPGYLGMIISLIGFPAITGSIYSGIPVVISIGALIVRTAFEDRMLREELAGYTEYSNTTKYRLLPYIW